MLSQGDLIDGGMDLVSGLIGKQRSKVTVEMPGIEDLKQKLNQIYGPAAAEGGTVAGPDKVSETEIREHSASSEAASRGTACLPCSQDHLSTCSGLLAEALRFARSDGIESPEVITRIGLCRDELNALERVDLRPEVTAQLPDWEKELVGNVLNGSRGLRHDMTEISGVADLERVAGAAQALRGKIVKGFFVERLKRSTPQQTLTLQQAKKIAAAAAEKEVEAKWHSQ